MSTPSPHSSFLRLMLAVLDDDERAAHLVLDAGDASAIAHYTAAKFVGSFDPAERDEMRRDTLAELQGPQR